MLFFSCSKETPDYYNITFKNNYFEEVDTLKMGNITPILSIPVDNTRQFSLVYGTYQIQIKTHSKLVIESDVRLIGAKENVIIILTPKGKIELDS